MCRKIVIVCPKLLFIGSGLNCTILRYKLIVFHSKYQVVSCLLDKIIKDINYLLIFSSFNLLCVHRAIIILLSWKMKVAVSY